ncbi:LuxR C-terminal-related transcriptional regulator [Streptomyces virginiae]|uniref:response regulator transcription factor n=1 Tax=Streptomyces virginiae TaxID=1961 RepID=UPI003332099D
MATITRSELTALEQETLELVADGLTFEQIGRRLNITAHAAELRMSRAKQKLGGTTTPHAVILACRAGLLDGRPQRHGDHAGYEAHRRRGEEPCDACRVGEREHRSRYKSRTRRAA